MSDHGARFSDVRQLVQGRYEERLPYVGMLFPWSFHQKYPTLIRIFKDNVKSLTTGFDLHATLKHLLELNSHGNDVFKTLHGTSLFSPIPVNRTCAEATIEPHWCSCLDWRKVKNNSEIALKATEHVIQHINDHVIRSTAKCQILKLKSLDSASVFLPNKKLLQFKGTKIQDKRGKAEFGEAMSTGLYLISSDIHYYSKGS